MQDNRQLHSDLRQAIRQLCARYPDTYWRQLDKEEAYPTEFVEAMTGAGYLAALIPERYGGAGVGLTEASIVLEEVHRCGGNAAACHAQMYIMGTLLRHGSEAQKSHFLPKIASGELRLQAFGVSEPDAGTDTTSIRTVADALTGEQLQRTESDLTAFAEPIEDQLLEAVSWGRDGLLTLDEAEEGEDLLQSLLEEYPLGTRAGSVSCLAALRSRGCECPRHR